MTSLSPQTVDDRVIASIRANIVFEKMIVSVLAVAGVAGVAHLAISVGVLVARGAMALGAGASAVIGAAAFAFYFFLAGFAASLAIGIPLFMALEKQKLRKVWPYVLAALVITIVILGAAGAAPSFEAPWRALFCVPSVAAAMLFGRKMRPLWRAAERAESSPAIVRLH